MWTEQTRSEFEPDTRVRCSAPIIAKMIALLKSDVVLRILVALSPRQIGKGKGKGNEPRAIEGKKRENDMGKRSEKYRERERDVGSKRELWKINIESRKVNR